MKCRNCGNDLTESSIFCGNCGTKVDEPEHVANDEPIDMPQEEPEAGEVPIEEPLAEEAPIEEPLAKEAPAGEPEAEEIPVEEPAAEEAPVGEPVADEAPAEEPQSMEPAVEEPAAGALPAEVSQVVAADADQPVKAEPAKKSFSWVFALIAVAVIGLLGVAALMKSGGSAGSEQTSVVYFTKESTMLAGVKQKGEPVEITDSWHEDKNNEAMIGIPGMRFLSEDGRYIYYIQDSEEAGYYMNFDLYKAPVAKLDDAVKIDTKVDSFEILDNNNVIYQRKGTIYYHDGESKLKFGKDVWRYHLNEDQNRILWMERNSSYETALYYQVLDQSEKKVKLIDEYPGYSYYYDKNLENIYILDEDIVYKLNPDKKNDKLIKDVENILSCNPETGAFYFTRESKNELELYYFTDGVEELISADMVYDDYSSYTSGKAAFCLFKEYDGLDQVYKLAIGSETIDLDDEDFVNWQVAYYDYDNLEKLYLLGMNDINDEDDTVMYEVLFGGEDSSEMKEYDTEVNRVLIETEKGVYYLKDYEDENGDLYFNGEFVASDVYHTMRIPESDQIIVLSDYDTDDYCGTISICDGTNLTPVAEHVMAVEVNSNGTMLMLSDYNVKRYRGDLLYYDGTSANSIAEDVKGFLPRYNSTYRNYYNQY